MYRNYVKRILDIVISFLAIAVLSPLLTVLTAVGLFAMKGNPFFAQDRPGKNGKLFRLIKFRTMSNRKDLNGNLLPDCDRLNGYGKFLRSTSLDELPELFNILAGQMSVVGPRPLLVKYLPLYSERQSHRHDVRPGLSGWAQVHGRNLLSWEERFEYDLWYTENVRFSVDAKIVLLTFRSILSREGISGEGSATMEEFRGTKE